MRKSSLRSYPSLQSLQERQHDRMRQKPMKRTAFKVKPRKEGPTSEKEPKPLSRAERMGSYSGGTTGPAPKAPPPVRSKSYLMRVASLPCYHCRIEGYSQAAHPNSGKARGKKLSDAGCFPMCCDRPGVKGCHARFDQYELVPWEQMPAYEAAALAWTMEQLGEMKCVS